MYNIHFQDARVSLADLLISMDVPPDIAEAITGRVIAIDALDFVSGGRYDWIVLVNPGIVTVSAPPDADIGVALSATW